MADNKLSSRAIDDFELVQDAISGNERAYEKLMHRYRHSVYHAMFKMVNNRDDADDLTIEAFGKAFRKLPSYAPNYAFSTWLFRIAINNCIDYIRKKKLQTVSMDEPLDPLSDRNISHLVRDFQPDPEMEMIREQKIAHVRRVVERIPEKYRVMIELRYYEELSYEEIAQTLELPLGTVKAQLFRAKELLYQQLTHASAKAYLDVRKAPIAEAA
jgi:RNA polymerase sigma-70 factor (ECF subfamily)